MSSKAVGEGLWASLCSRATAAPGVAPLTPPSSSSSSSSSSLSSSSSSSSSIKFKCKSNVRRRVPATLLVLGDEASGKTTLLRRMGLVAPHDQTPAVAAGSEESPLSYTSVQIAYPHIHSTDENSKIERNGPRIPPTKKKQGSTAKLPVDIYQLSHPQHRDCLPPVLHPTTLHSAHPVHVIREP